MEHVQGTVDVGLGIVQVRADAKPPAAHRHVDAGLMEPLVDGAVDRAPETAQLGDGGGRDVLF